jgi:amidophosphoribosyltransferase
MCGIIGLAGTDVSEKLYLGLMAMQHRGQDSCGIVTTEGLDKRFRIVKEKGLVSEVFSKDDLRNLRGSVGIGHVRYATCGNDMGSEAQPFITEHPRAVSLIHNGNIANYAELRKKYTSVETDSDSELVLMALSVALQREGDVFRAVASLMEELNGAFSCIAIIPGEGLLAFRDPNGIRPLILSKNGVASESVALDIVGEEVIDDVKPGEAVLIRPDGRMERRVVSKRSRHAHCMFEYVYFSRPDSTIDKKSVYEVRLALGRELAKIFNKQVDVVMPVPDTSRTAAQAFSEATGIPQREGLIKNRYIGRTFIMPSQAARESSVRLKLNPIIHEIKGKRVLLIDDSIVRGTTAKKIVDTVRRAGAREVHMAVTCPKIVSPCFYGIDMTKKNELLAAHVQSDEEIAKAIGADSVTYQSIDGLRRALGIEGLCAACLTGEYPTDVSRLLARQDVKGRPYEVS